MKVPRDVHHHSTIAKPWGIFYQHLKTKDDLDKFFAKSLIIYEPLNLKLLVRAFKYRLGHGEVKAPKKPFNTGLPRHVQATIKLHPGQHACICLTASFLKLHKLFEHD